MKIFYELIEAVRELPNAVSADIEQGSHHWNNIASAAFEQQHPNIIKAINNLQDLAETVEAELAIEERSYEKVNQAFEKVWKDNERLRAELADASTQIQHYVGRVNEMRAERDKYRDTLLSRHGGEPLALLDELDQARAERDALRELLEESTSFLIDSPKLTEMKVRIHAAIDAARRGA